MKSIDTRLTGLEKRAAEMRGPDVPMATVTLVDGSSKGPLLWVDAAKIVLDGGAIAVESDNADTEALLRAMLGKGAML